MLDKLAHLFTPKAKNNHRAKIIQNGGLALLVGIFIFTQATIQLVSSKSGIAGFVLGYASSISPGQVIEQTNQERSKYGLSALSHNGSLSAAAASKASHMFAQQYWAHIAPDGTSPWYFIKNAGYSYSVAGENLARDFGDTGSVMVAWMNSPTHKENIVNSKYREMGVAVVDGVLNGVETTLVVQMFGSRSQVAAATTPLAAATQPKPVIAEQKDPAEIPSEAIEEKAEVEPEPEPIEEIQIDREQTISVPTVQSATSNSGKVRVSPLAFTKVIGTSIVLLIVLVLAYDALIAHKKNLTRLVGKNWAHFGFFGILLVIMYISTAGQII